MAGDLIREVRRATLQRLKADEPLTALVPTANIHPSTVPAGSGWPFTRFDAPQSVPLDGNCHAGAEVTFFLHCFAKPMESGGQMTETAEDHCSRIASAIKLAVHNRRVPVADASALLRVRSVRLIQDGAEADAYHGIVSVSARALVS